MVYFIRSRFYRPYTGLRFAKIVIYSTYYSLSIFFVATESFDVMQFMPLAKKVKTPLSRYSPIKYFHCYFCKNLGIFVIHLFCCHLTYPTCQEIKMHLLVSLLSSICFESLFFMSAVKNACSLSFTQLFHNFIVVNYEVVWSVSVSEAG